MAIWTPQTNGQWQDAGHWDTGVAPNGVGAVATFNTSAGLFIVGVTETSNVTVGTININASGAGGVAIRGSLSDTGTITPTLSFNNGVLDAQLNVTDSSATASQSLASSNLLNALLVSDLAVNLTTAATIFDMAVNISGAGAIKTVGPGTLLLRGTNSFSGGIFVAGGVLDAAGDGSLGSGDITIQNGGTFRSSGIVNNRIGMNGSQSGVAGDASITAATGDTLTLTTDLFSLDAASKMSFGSATDEGTIILSIFNVVHANTTEKIDIAGGIVRFGNANSAGFLFNHSGTGLTQVLGGATLDTGGFAARVANLDMDGGTVTSSIGALNLTVNDRFGALNAQNGTITGTGLADTLVFNAEVGFSLTSTTFSNWTNGTDTITFNGNDANNTFNGSTQSDIINGFGGNDTLNGHEGADTLRGGTGDDTYTVANTGVTLVELAGEGTDTVNVSTITSFTLAANVENLNMLSTVANKVGLGNAVDNVITVGGEHPTIAGLAGNDRLVQTSSAGVPGELIGGTGNDVYVIANRFTSTIEFAGEGVDTVETTHAIYGLQNQIENLTATDGGAHGALVGNILDNIITGNTGVDDLFGRDGNDTLNGGTGAANTLLGQQGNDTYQVNAAGDSVIEFLNEGIDIVLASTASFTLGANVENLTRVGTAAFVGVGNGLDNIIIGGAGADTLNGGGGNDTLKSLIGVADVLVGGAGNDLFLADISGSSIVEAVGEGIDTVDTTLLNFTLPTNVENIQAGTPSAINAQTFVGNALANTMSGNNGDGFLSGLDGADILIGRGGNDTLVGGIGADQFRYLGGETGVDTITDFTPGTDKIAISAGFTPTATLGFVQGGSPVALNPVSTFLYNSTTGIVSYDDDGTGAGAAIALASIGAGKVLSLGDFIVF